MMGLTYSVHPSSFEEDLPKSSFADAAAYAVATAHGKAADVVKKLSKSTDASDHPDVTIGSDTIVVLDGMILEKPSSEGDAVRMLRLLSCREHEVITAVSLITRSGAERKFASKTRVWFGELSDDMINAYVRSGEPMDKAGAYGIQGLGGAFVSRIEGCYFTVMGLPMYEVAANVRQLIDDGML